MYYINTKQEKESPEKKHKNNQKTIGVIRKREKAANIYIKKINKYVHTYIYIYIYIYSIYTRARLFCSQHIWPPFGAHNLVSIVYENLLSILNRFFFFSHFLLSFFFRVDNS